MARSTSRRWCRLERIRNWTAGLGLLHVTRRPMLGLPRFSAFDQPFWQIQRHLGPMNSLEDPGIQPIFDPRPYEFHWLGLPLASLHQSPDFEPVAHMASALHRVSRPAPGFVPQRPSAATSAGAAPAPRSGLRIAGVIACILLGFGVFVISSLGFFSSGADGRLFGRGAPQSGLKSIDGKIPESVAQIRGPEVFFV